MKRILGIGNALVDVMTILEDDSVVHKLGFPRGSMTLVDAEKSRQIRESTSQLKRKMASGGSVANTIHGLGMLNVPAGFIGAIGRDETGDFFEKELEAAGIETCLFRKEISTGTAVALVSPDSERTFATHLGAAIELSADDLKDDCFSGWDWLYLEGYLITNIDLVEKACSLAKKKGMKIAIDLSSFNVVEAFLDKFRCVTEKYVDLIFANEEEARAFTGLKTEEALIRLSELCETAIIKTGKKGSLIRRGKEVIKEDALEVESRDTTGASDLYAAGFLYGLATGATLEKCTKYATILAGNIIQVVGARMERRKWESVLEAIKNV